MLGRRGPDGRDGERLSARRRIWLVYAVVVVAIASSAVISLRPLMSGHSAARRVQTDSLGLERIAKLRTALADFQVFAEPRMAHLAPAAVADLASGALKAQAVPPTSLAVYESLSAAGLTRTARAIAAADTAFSKAFSGLGVLAPGLASTTVSAAIAAERAAYEQMWSVSAAAETQLRDNRDRDLGQGMANLDDGRALVLGIDALATVVGLVAAVVVGQSAQSREREARADARRRSYDTKLQEGLEMARTEDDAYDIVARALPAVVPRLRAEMLVADSSRAHFRQMLVTGAAEADEWSGCGVMSPLDCPATTRGHTLVFADSREVNACPYLRDRPSGDCSAACIVVSVGGKTIGVLHATAPNEEPPTTADVRYLEISARRTSERVGMIRAFEKSEVQAHSDPLTGLWNRRSLENRIRDLAREGTPYALAYGDLDHFKLLNDTHGHEAGDQALRLFSRVLRDAMRPNDVAARYGGEEFVVVLPDCTAAVAEGVLERVRERLALALTSGRVPAFTVSFGLATSSDAGTFDEVVALADRFLLQAKAAGRNRVVLAATPGVETDAGLAEGAISRPT